MLAWKCRLSLPLLDWDDDDVIRSYDRAVLRAHRAPVQRARRERLPRRAGRDRSRARLPGVGRVACGRRRGRGHRRRSVAECHLQRGSASIAGFASRRSPSSPARLLPTPTGSRRSRAHAVLRAPEHAELAVVPGRAPTSGGRRARSRRSKARHPAHRSTPCCERLARHGLSAYAVDVTSPDVRSLGLCVARVVAPELCALDVSHRARFLGGTRLYTAAHEAGLVPAPLELCRPEPRSRIPFP